MLRRVAKGERARQRLRKIRKEGREKRIEQQKRAAEYERLRESSESRESKKIEKSNRGHDEREGGASTKPRASSSRESHHVEMSNRNPGMNTRFGWAGPKFLSRNAMQVERMVSAYDRANGGTEKRLLLKRTHECNIPIKACKFYNINECNLPYMKVHGMQGEEVEHCCSDCLYVVPGMIMRHRAETIDCPIFVCMQSI